MRKPFRTLFLLGTLVTFVPASIATAQVAASPDLPADTVAYAQQAIDTGRYIGLIIGMIDGDKVMIQAFGQTSKKSGKAPDAGTVFEIASITKTFTATLLAEEVLAGRMKLSDPVQKYLPKGTAIPQVGDRPITLEDLATHRSGLPRRPANLVSRDPDNAYAGYDTAKLWEGVQTVNLTRSPGVSFEYSNFGVGLMGELIARKSGTPYRALVTQKIFKPLRMTHSDVVLSPVLRPYAAQAHDETGRTVAYATGMGLAPAGAIYSSMTDMLAYLRANMAAAAKSGGTSALSQAMAFAQQPRADVDAPGRRIGLNWMSEPRSSVVWHNGSTTGFSSFIGFTPDGKRGVVVLANTAVSPTTTGIGHHLLDPAVPRLPLFKEVAVATEKLDAYVGDYQLSPTVMMTVVRDGDHLVVRRSNQPDAPLSIYAKAEEAFVAKTADIQITFDTPVNGKAGGMALFQNGSTQANRSPRMDAAQVAQLRAASDALAKRVKDQLPVPGSEVALRRNIDELRRGQPSYDQMSPGLAAATRQQLSALQGRVAGLGDLQSVTFKGVGQAGADIFEVVFAKGKTEWRIFLIADGKVDGVNFRPIP